MDWFILSIISVTTLSIASLLQRILMREKESDPISYSIVFQFVSSFLVLLFALSKGFIFPPIKELTINFILAAILYAAYTVFLFKALKTIEVSRVTILTATTGFWAIIAGIIFLGESLSLIKIIGALLVFSAVVLISQKDLRISLTKGSIYALVAAFCFGVALVNDAYILRYSEAFSYLAISFFLPGLLLLIINPTSFGKMKLFANKDKLSKMGILGIFYSAAALTTYLAFQQGGNASQVVPIVQSRITLTVLLAAVFLKEKGDLGRKLLAAIIVSAGVLLIK